MVISFKRRGHSNHMATVIEDGKIAIVDLETNKIVDMGEDDIGYQQAEFVADLPKVQYGADMMEEVIAEPTLDRYLDRAPKLLEPVDYEGLVKLLHKKREMFIKAEADKKAGIKPEENTDVTLHDDGNQ